MKISERERIKSECSKEEYKRVGAFAKKTEVESALFEGDWYSCIKMFTSLTI